MFNIPGISDDADKEILYVTVSPDELKLGICVGQKLIKNVMKVTEIVIYNRESTQSDFGLQKMRDFEFEDACLQFQFSVSNTEELLFAARDRIFAFNYLDEGAETRVIYELN